MEELFQLITKTYGIAGLIILSPVVGCVLLFRENRTLTKEYAKTLAELHKEHAAVVATWQDKAVIAERQRVVDAQSISTKLMEIVSEQSALNKETNITLSHVDEHLSVLRTGLVHRGQ